MTNLKKTLSQLHTNLNTLREREAKYAGNVPLDLLNQIADPEQAIALTQQAIAGELSEAEWQAVIKPLLVFPPGTPTYEVIAQPSPPAEDKERRDLGILLKKVKTFWIEGVLEKSIHTMALIDLGKETQAEAVAHAWEQVLELPDHSRQTLPPDKKIGQIFDEMNRALLILGEPGSGKTITLLQLARDLIAQAESDESFSQPIPVVFNLSSWEKDQPLLDWLVAELSAKYQIPKPIGHPWLENSRLLPLLDGLDEVKQENRQACVEAINQLELGLSGVAVCSRVEEYRSLSTRLQLNGAIRLQPLTLEQMYDYLEAAGSRLDALRIALEKDNNLQILAQTPLILGIMSLAYQDISVETLQRFTQDSLETRRKHLFQVYIERMFKRRGKGSKPYPDAQTIGWLTWLAQQMLRRNETNFLIEHMQPDWLPTAKQKWYYTICSALAGCLPVALLAWWLVWELMGFAYTATDAETRQYYALLGGPVFGLAMGLATWFFIKARYGLVTGVLLGVVFGSALGLLLWPAAGYTAALLGGVAVGLVVGTNVGLYGRLRADESAPAQEEIRTIEVKRWVGSRVFMGMVVGVVIGIVLWLSADFTDAINVGLSPQEAIPLILGFDTYFWTYFGSGLWIAGGLYGALLFGLLLAKPEIEQNERPNQSIRRSGQSGLWTGLLSAACIGIPLGIAAKHLFVVSGALMIGTATTLWNGGFAFIQHFILRFFLWRNGHIPWPYVRFLDYATERIFLRKVGGGYIFIHRYLMEYFASLTDEDIERLSTEIEAKST
jgi:DNA polymerase III delta prime subunit